MAVTLQVRAGSSLKAHLRYWQPDKSDLINTTGYTARLQLRATQRPGRVLMDTREYNDPAPAPSGTVLARIEPGHWRLVLDRGITRSLPATTRFELELVSDTDPDDVTPLVYGVINVTPEAVVND